MRRSVDASVGLAGTQLAAQAWTEHERFYSNIPRRGIPRVVETHSKSSVEEPHSFPSHACCHTGAEVFHLLACEAVSSLLLRYTLLPMKSQLASSAAIVLSATKFMERPFHTATQFWGFDGGSRRNTAAWFCSVMASSISSHVSCML